MPTAMKKRSHLPRSERPEKKALNGQLRRMSERDLLAIILGSGVSGSNVKQVRDWGQPSRIKKADVDDSE